MHPILDKLKKDGITKIKLGIFDVDGVMGKIYQYEEVRFCIGKWFWIL